MLSTISKMENEKEIINMKKKRRIRQKRLLRRLLILQTISLLILVGFIIYGYATKESSNYSNSSVETSQVVTYDSAVEVIEQPLLESFEAEEDSSDNVEEVTEEVIEPDLTKANIVKSIGDVNPEYLDIVQRDLLLLPDGMLEYYTANAWEVSVTDENIDQVYCGGMYAGEPIIGAICYEKMFIVMANCKEAIYYGDIFHEFGHYLDYINDRPSLSPEFSEIFAEEMPTLDYNINYSRVVSSEKEFFAETFRQYIICPSKCTPKALEFIKSQIDIFQKRCSL